MIISVVTACLNNETTLRDTLESVLAQDYSEIEHIVVDGGSTDGTIGILREYEDRYLKYGKTLKWKSGPDGGIYDAMNRGIERATGVVVGLLNADDFYTSSDILSKVAETISGTTADGRQIDAVYGDIHFVRPRNLKRCVRYYSSKGFRRWKMHMGFMPAHPSFYCRREIYIRYGKFDTGFRTSADFDQLLRLILIHKINIAYIPADFVTMRTGGVSSSGFGSYLQIFHEKRKAFKKNGVYSNIVLQGLCYCCKIYELLKSHFLQTIDD